MVILIVLIWVTHFATEHDNRVIEDVAFTFFDTLEAIE